jgi:heme-degrading monooxygenase HmoA
MVPLALFAHAGINILAPGFRSALSPGIKLTTTASDGTAISSHLLKGPEAEDHTLYASHTVWQTKSAFEAWTKSEEFRAAHARAGNEVTGPLYLEHPKFEGFEVRQTVTPKAAVA